MREVSFRSDIKFSFYIFVYNFFKIYRKLSRPPASQVSAMSLKDGNWGVSLFATELNSRVKKPLLNEILCLCVFYESFDMFVGNVLNDTRFALES